MRKLEYPHWRPNSVPHSRASSSLRSRLFSLHAELDSSAPESGSSVLHDASDCFPTVPPLETVSSFFESYCIQCRSGAEVNVKVDLCTISMEAAAEVDLDFWQLGVEIFHYEEVPPEDE